RHTRLIEGQRCARRWRAAKTRVEITQEKVRESVSRRRTCEVKPARDIAIEEHGTDVGSKDVATDLHGVISPLHGYDVGKTPISLGAALVVPIAEVGIAGHR